MQEVHVNVYIHAPIERVFDAVADHESFLRLGDSVYTTIRRPGSAERNGLGCVRVAQTGRWSLFVEEITGWARPSSFEYQIRESTYPLRHYGGRLRFTPRAGGTEIDWTSSFDVTVPLIGSALEPITRRIAAVAFTEMLLAAKSRIEAV